MADLYEITFDPNPDTIEYLEDLLEQAKTGEIQGFAIALNKKGPITANGWSGILTNCMAMIGELESLKVDIMRCNVSQRYDCEGCDLGG